MCLQMISIDRSSHTLEIQSVLLVLLMANGRANAVWWCLGVLFNIFAYSPLYRILFVFFLTRQPYMTDEKSDGGTIQNG